MKVQIIDSLSISPFNSQYLHSVFASTSQEHIHLIYTSYWLINSFVPVNVLLSPMTLFNLISTCSGINIAKMAFFWLPFGIFLYPFIFNICLSYENAFYIHLHCSLITLLLSLGISWLSFEWTPVQFSRTGKNFITLVMKSIWL